MTDTERGYLAGFMDGEGTISLTAEKLSESGGGVRSHRFGASVTAANTHQGVMDYLCRVVGAGDVSLDPRREGHKDCYKWRCPRSRVKALLVEIAPLLVIKREQAELLLEFICLQDEGKRAGHKGIAIEDIGAAIAIYQRIRELNRKGTEETEIELPEFALFKGKARETQCEEDGCEDRIYHRGPWCYKHWMLNKSPETKNCVQCGAEFESRNVLRKFCGSRCQAAYTWDVTKGKDRERHTLVTEEQVKEAIQLLLTGQYTQTDVAQAVGANRSALGEILHGRARKEWKLDLPSKEQLKAGHEIWRKRREEETILRCELCDAEFHPKNGKMRFCGKVCYWRSENARRREARHAAAEAAS